MAIPVILKGDTSATLTFAIAGERDFTGCVLHIEIGTAVSRIISSVPASGTFTLKLTATETALLFPGTHRVRMTLIKAIDGERVSLPWGKIVVSLSPSEVYDASIDVQIPATEIAQIPERFNNTMLRDKLNEVISKIGGAALAVLLSCTACADVLSVETAPMGEIYNDTAVVTNVTLDASGLATPATVSNIVTKSFENLGISAPDYSTNNAALVETIEATAPAPGNYAAVSNRAMNAVQKGEDLEMIDDGEEYGYKLGPGGGYPWDGSGWSNYESFFFPLDYINSAGSWNWYQIFSDQDDPDKYAATLVRQADLHIAKNEVYDNIDSRGYLTNETDPSVPSWAKAANPPTETDPTVPAWAKAQTKPSYAAGEIAGAMTYEDTTAAIREQSLGGIWDETLQVWWTPRMSNGSLTYEATTNVNLNAEN